MEPDITDSDLLLWVDGLIRAERSERERGREREEEEVSSRKRGLNGKSEARRGSWTHLRTSSTGSSRHIYVLFCWVDGGRWKYEGKKAGEEKAGGTSERGSFLSKGS